MSAIWSLSGESERRGHLVFADAEVIRGGPLFEVTGRGREAWRAAPGFRAVAVSSTSSPHTIRGRVTASEICMRQSEPPCLRKSAVPEGIFQSLASSNGAQPIDRV